MHLSKWILPPAYNRGPSDHTGDSDNTNLSNMTKLYGSNAILTLQMVEIYIIWEGILTERTNDREGILTDKSFLHQNPWDSFLYSHVMDQWWY